MCTQAPANNPKRASSPRQHWYRLRGNTICSLDARLTLAFSVATTLFPSSTGACWLNTAALLIMLPDVRLRGGLEGVAYRGRCWYCLVSRVSALVWHSVKLSVVWHFSVSRHTIAQHNLSNTTPPSSNTRAYSCSNGQQEGEGGWFDGAVIS